MSSKNIIEVNNLSKSFGKRKVIDDIGFSVKEGDIYGFLGQNGSGKTTTIRMLLNLIHPDTGEIKLNSFDLKKDFFNAIKEVGAVVEIPKFYSYLSGRKNLLLIANLIHGIDDFRVNEVLEMVGLINRSDEKVKTYSLGMMQRLGIANALLSNPKLVILDEPTNGLDPQGMKEIRNIILNLASEKNITFFISTHMLHEVEQICNKVAILHQGKIITEGLVNELLNIDLESVEIHTPHFNKVIDLTKNLKYIRSVERFEKGVKLKLERGFCAELNRFLISNNIDVEYIIPRTQSLESYFINMTGGDNNLA
ncbi:MAG: ABC transporter ATP-binding protein [Bacillota bacterium]|nr:ABC transporter ATP-binding protein [Bacillota bacterium]